MAQWREYVPVRQRRAAAQRLARESARRGEVLAPVVPKDKGRAIATTVWGRAWCENLERYLDYENRLPRGRTYVRNGSVVDLKASSGEIHAIVQGSSRYRVEVRLQKITSKRWSALTRACGAEIGTLVELLEGRISRSVMAIMTERGAGLFPEPREIEMTCSCPDWASMCKHIAAVLYGIGVRLDDSPRLLFELRGVDPAELVANAGIGAITASANDGALAGDLQDIFGVELDVPAPAPVPMTASRAGPATTRKADEGKPQDDELFERLKAWADSCHASPMSKVLEDLVGNMSVGELARLAGTSVEQVIARVMGNGAAQSSASPASSMTATSVRSTNGGRPKKLPKGSLSITAVLDVLRTAKGPVAAADVRSQVGGTANQVRAALAKLAEAKQIKVTGERRGTRYALK